MYWENFLKREFKEDYFIQLSDFLKEAYLTRTIYPKRDDVFNAFAYAKYEELKVVIIGQDPYHQPQQAHGLCFSVNPGIMIPPSLKNIYKELSDDMGCSMPETGCLIPWAKQGVLLLNSILTVEDSKPLSHQNKGW
ncbi:MAG TPA: uracil-DNA glycosylase, partial [Erysipelotrichaceae bacterium]|nr:uracil-DNA glycosylase [Erysipelotrichaceae bacterium]